MLPSENLMLVCDFACVRRFSDAIPPYDLRTYRLIRCTVVKYKIVIKVIKLQQHVTKSNESINFNSLVGSLG